MAKSNEKNFEQADSVFGVVRVSVCDDEPMPVHLYLESIHTEEQEAQAAVAAYPESYTYERECNNGIEAQWLDVRELTYAGIETVDYYKKSPSILGRLIGKKVLSVTVEYAKYCDVSGGQFFKKI